MSVPADVDLRGFVFSLEPIHQRQQWRLNRLQRDLAVIQADIRTREAELARLISHWDEQARTLNYSGVLRLAPNLYQQMLMYLSQSQSRIDEQRQALVDRQREHVQVQKLCLAAQLRLDGVLQHRTDELKSYANTIRHRQAGEQDRDWAARRSIRAVALPEAISNDGGVL
ncbi:hypothetical protein [Variovorax terrae]|uniref:Flagellar FliJ protein n=1 Tax=Variovorax terrae TaxID=2923278 RepID=A0A9X2ANM0_9BURK|nr:hypothetical protein [Variovorax terrae]MCJ0764539.1 hypothetical protein [Variovorax terrae]